MIVNRRGGEDNIGAGLANQLGHAAAGFVIVENGQIAKLRALIIGSD
jgi:hypothetical protein